MPYYFVRFVLSNSPSKGEKEEYFRCDFVFTPYEASGGGE